MMDGIAHLPIDFKQITITIKLFILLHNVWGNIMKKVTALLLCLAMLLTLFVGCGNSSEKEPEIDTEAFKEAFAEQEAASAAAVEVPAEEPEPEVPQVAVLSEITVYWLGDADTYTVGSDLTLDESGRIVAIQKLYSDIACTYDADGALIEAATTQDDGAVGYERWTYVDKQYTEYNYDPNDGFHSLRNAPVELTLDDAGNVIAMLQNMTLTDAEDGSVSYRMDQYEFTYDEAGRVSTATYYTDGEADNTATFTYDENGNLLSCSHVGADSNSEYLRFAFTYTMVDETSLTPVEIDPFTAYLNWHHLSTQLL